MSKILFLDFEFNRVTHPFVNLVSCATLEEDGTQKNFWLHNDKKEQEKLKQYLSEFDLFIGYSTVAESRSFLALGLNPLESDWIDLFLEYRMITNSNDQLCWGNQLIDGKVKYVSKPPPKWERTGHEEPGFKPTHSLAEATYKMLSIIRDTEHKTKMRDLIISDPEVFSADERHAILAYGAEDVKDLPKIYRQINEEIVNLCDTNHSPNAELIIENLNNDQMWRGRYSAHTAIMENIGYPIDYEKTLNFSRKIPSILYDVQREINNLFPEVKPFKWNKLEQRFSLNQAAVKNWITQNHEAGSWPLTEKKALSLKLEAFTKFYDFKHDYPEDNFGAQMVRFLKLKQSIYGFSTSSKTKKRTFWDSVGPDKRVRPYMNHYGAQTSRTQPAATGFMFLKPAWMRALVAPPKGYAIGGIDYSSVEFFIQALMSGDQAMVDAYLSGDVYLAFAIDSALAPIGATKATHKSERDLCKSTVLGIGFNMTKYGLAIKLSADSGRIYTEDEAQGFIDSFDASYPFYKEYRDGIFPQYEANGFIMLQDGWVMWGDNTNKRSVGNVPIQGSGAVIMRLAVDKAVALGLEVIFTLHDAIYIQYKVGEEWKMKILRDCMKEAFIEIMTREEGFREDAKKVRMDPFAWSPDYEKDSEIKVSDDFVLPVSNIYIDERAVKDYEKFSKYFENDIADDL